MRIAHGPRVEDSGRTSKGTVMIGIGWAEWLEKYEEVANQWHQRGFNTLIVEWRGQAASSRFLEDKNKSWVPSFDILIHDFHKLFQAQFEGLSTPVYVLGHSMGGHLVLRWWLEKGHPYHNIRGLILASPMHWPNTDPFPLPVAQLIAHAAERLGLSQHYAPGCEGFDQTRIAFEENRVTGDATHYARMLAQLNANPALKSGGVTFGWLEAAFASIRQLEKLLKRGVPPRGRFLVLGAVDDEVVRYAGVRRVASFLPHAGFVSLSDARHELLQENNAIRQRVWQAVDGFVSE